MKASEEKNLPLPMRNDDNQRRSSTLTRFVVIVLPTDSNSKSTKRIDPKGKYKYELMESVREDTTVQALILVESRTGRNSGCEDTWFRWLRYLLRLNLDSYATPTC